MMDLPTERAEEIFCSALEIKSDAERSTFVRQACSGDDELLGSVQGMLSSYTGGEQLFDAVHPTSFSVVELTNSMNVLAGGEGAADAPMADDGEVGKQIGNYKLLEKIGEGGGGNVYLAEQEKPVRRQVALKIIKAGMDTKSVIARFEAERQALAMMEHPSIARVLNAGETDTGRPYFVMELVHGIQVTKYCEECRLDVDQRLELFIQICHAIQHAHQKGIIHRDIKPSNILIEQMEGMVVPKVIDFGIAKATGEQKLVEQPAFTVLQPFVGTPAYMSPEQADLAELDIDVRSDIYSLGVLLYELLTGRTPFDQKELIRSGLEQMRRTIRECEPLRPSVKLSALSPEDIERIAGNRHIQQSQLMSVLEGDLDWIVMKALEKERERRYQSADGFANDIQRYLKNEPVVARPPSRRYRFRKLVRRNKAAFVAVGIATCGLVAGLGTSTWMFVRERAARMEQARLRHEAEKLQEKAEFRALISQAAVRIKYGNRDEADTLLGRVPVEQTPSSLEAAEVFQAVASWHMQAGHTHEAAARFRSMARALSSVDSSDVPQVSASMMPAAAVVAYAGDMHHYEDFRQMAVLRFGDTLNPAVARQMIKVCLLAPADAEMLQALERSARVVEQGFESIKADSGEAQWASLSLALFYYRAGDYSEVLRWVNECLALPQRVEVLTASIQIIRAMIERQAGLLARASNSLTEGREPVQRAFGDKSWLRQEGAFSWFDWIIADLLLKEAEILQVSRDVVPQQDPALFYALGEMERADAALDRWPEELPISPDYASMLREIGDWNALRERWEQAGARYDFLLRFNVSTGAESTIDDIRLAMALVEQNDLDGYEKMCKSSASRYAGMDNPTVAQRVLRQCLLVAADDELMTALDYYARLTEQSYFGRGGNSVLKGWQASALALWTYRSEDFSTALNWCERANPEKSGFPTRDATVMLIRALALNGLGRIDEAKRQLEASRPLINAILADNPPKSLGWVGYWFDRVNVCIHMREAEEVIGSKPVNQN